MQSRSLLSLSPNNYSSHSSVKLAEIAARVAQKFTQESDSEFNHVFGFTNDDNWSHRNQKPDVEQVVDNSSEGDKCDHDFEFPFLCRELNSSPVSADQIFHNGQIRPTFPLFHTGLSLGHGENRTRPSKPPTRPTPSIRVPLKTLLFDRDPLSSSSSESDDLDGIPPGTYCVWKPKSAAAAAAEQSSGGCNKSKSTGSSSKRWKFRDLVRRSNSEGNDTFLFVAPSNGNAKKIEANLAKANEKSASMNNSADIKVASKVKTKAVRGGASQGLAAASEPHESYYGRNRSMKDGNRRRSFLPYKRELVGLFANVNGMSWNLLPF